MVSDLAGTLACGVLHNVVSKMPNGGTESGGKTHAFTVNVSPHPPTATVEAVALGYDHNRRAGERGHNSDYCYVV